MFNDKKMIICLIMMIGCLLIEWGTAFYTQVLAWEILGAKMSQQSPSVYEWKARICTVIITGVPVCCCFLHWKLKKYSGWLPFWFGFFITAAVFAVPAMWIGKVNR